LLNNFEIVATSMIAFLFFREAISGYLATAIGLVVLASIVLSFEGEGSFQFSEGSALVLSAACCWGLENNCTRMLSSKSSIQITVVKGICSGLGSLLIAWAVGEKLPGIGRICGALVLGFVAYGLSINFYIRAQKDLGAAKTSAYYSVAPFLGVFFGMVLLGERPGIRFYAGLLIMLAATVLMVKDTVTLQHTHMHTYTHFHAHRHGDTVHAHFHTHAHTHSADESVHDHSHQELGDHDHIHP